MKEDRHIPASYSLADKFGFEEDAAYAEMQDYRQQLQTKISLYGYGILGILYLLALAFIIFLTYSHLSS
ncbi:MAG: hypothetical protein KDK69_03490 [Chlamydiia bacterium]|nr:hypothetical protein [Chlamydiia bacterium]